MKELGFGMFIIAIGAGALMLVMMGGVWLYQPLRVIVAETYTKTIVLEKESLGRARLLQAENERKIMIEQARAEKESSELRAEAIAIVGKAAKDFPEYRTQEFIGAFAEALKEGKINQIMYVPTEANIPITEAGKR